MNHTFGSNGYRSPEQKELMKGIPTIPFIIPRGCWCKLTPDNLRDHEFDEDMEGIHSNVCPGIKKDKSGKVVCGGKTLCYYCQTPIHGCVSHHNERGEVSYFEEDGTEIKLVARYHSWCGEIAKMQRVDNLEQSG